MTWNTAVKSKVLDFESIKYSLNQGTSRQGRSVDGFYWSVKEKHSNSNVTHSHDLSLDDW